MISKKLPERLKSAVEIHRLAGLYLGQTLAPGTYQTAPIPVMSGDALFICFLFGRGEVLDGERGYHVWPPSYMGSFRAVDGSFQQLRAVSPGSFGLNHPPDQPLGPGLAPLERGAAPYVAALAQYAQVLDGLLPVFAGITDSTSSTREAARQLPNLSSKVFEPTLWTYYEVLAEPWIEWLQANG